MSSKTNQADFGVQCRNLISGGISVGLVCLLLVFPLIYHHSYVDILETKYMCYYITALAMLGFAAVAAVVAVVRDFSSYDGAYTKEWLAARRAAGWRKWFSAADWAVLLFILIAGISTLQSDYLYEAFWGNEGRYSGLFLLGLYVAVYFLVSRCWNFKEGFMHIFLVSGLIMCVIGITDFFQLDVLDFRGEVLPDGSAMFTSTVGNINNYTAYVGLMMAFASVMFVTADSAKKTVWFGFCMTVSFLAMIFGCSDNAYLSIGTLFGFLPLLAFKNRRGFCRYVVMAALFMLMLQCAAVLNVMFADRVIEFSGLFGKLAGMSVLPVLTASVWVLAALVLFLDRKFGARYERIGKGVVVAWGVFLGVAVLALCFVIYDANFGGHPERYQAFANYLVFNDKWGTYRGYIWKEALRLYGEFPLMHKIFGYGPDTFGLLTHEEIWEEMKAVTTLVYDNAHNEYLQYLVTIGPVGTVAYVVFLLSAGISMAGKLWKQPCVAGLAFGALCYGVQAVVNLSVPVVAPMMWLFLSMGMAGYRQQGEQELKG